MNYLNYECSICRRIKSFLKDTQRVTPNHCTITKGCLGKLSVVGETKIPTQTKLSAGIEDWYPRGTKRGNTNDVNVSESFDLSTSATGSLTLAVKGDDTLPYQLNLTLEQRRVGDIQFQQFTFRLTSGATSVSGRDSSGKNLRFDQEAIDEGRVVARVNGVETTATFSGSKVSFITPVVGVVDVLVYSTKSTTTKILTLTRNKSLNPTLARGSWANINYVERIDIDGNVSKWYLYSVDTIAGLTTGRIKIEKSSEVGEAIFLLASTPYQSTDRYLNFVVPQSSLIEDFNLAHESGELTASTEFLSEIYPPISIPNDAFVGPDQFTVAASSAIILDTEEVRFASRKILGPV